MEYVIEAANSDDMRSWLATIRYCMRSTPTVQVQGVETLTAMPNLTTIPASPPPAATAPTISTNDGKIDAFLTIYKDDCFFGNLQFEFIECVTI